MANGLKLPDVWRLRVGPLLLGYMLHDCGAKLSGGVWWLSGGRSHTLWHFRRQLAHG